jgi:CheY-like chemotaxis protein
MTTWMVVEDEPDLYDMLLSMTQIMGIDGLAFTTGEEAVDWIDDVDQKHIHAEAPQLALLDIRLPGDISGPAVGSRLRRSPILQNTTIVLMTAYKLSPQEEKAVIREAGANLLVYKPLPSLPELQKMLKKAIVQQAGSPRA